MKHFLLAVALLASSITVAAQSTVESAGKKAKQKSDSALPVDPDTQLVTYSKVIEIPGTTQEQLYTRAANWIASTEVYRVASSKQLQEASDKSQLIVSGETRARGPMNQIVGTVSHSLTIYCKDGRYKYVLTNLREETNSTKPNGIGSGGAFENEKPACGFMLMFPAAWNTIKRHTDEDVQELLARLTTTMAATGASKAPSDF